MSIKFDDWRLYPDGEILAYQYDNLSRTLLISGEIPSGWEWQMQVKCRGHYDAIPLEPMEGGIGAVLSDKNLALGGVYDFQLRGTQGEIIRHTNVIHVEVSPSLSGSGTWPMIPSEFIAMEKEMRKMLGQAEDLLETSVDPTLTKSGKAAEAKTVGDRFREQGKQIDDVTADLKSLEDTLPAVYYNKSEIDAALGSYINDIDALIGDVSDITGGGA